MNNETNILRKMRKGTEMVDCQSTVEQVLNIDDQKYYESKDVVERCHMLHDT